MEGHLQQNPQVGHETVIDGQDAIGLERAKDALEGEAGDGELAVGEDAGEQAARDEGFEEIADWMETLAKAERSHANRFQKALDSLED